MIITAAGNTVRNALRAARRVSLKKFGDSKEVFRSGGEDGLYRVHLSDSSVVEITVRPVPAEAFIQ